MIKLFLSFYFNIVFSELIFKLSSKQSGWHITAALFIVTFAVVFTLICKLFNKKGSRIAQFALFALLFFYYAVQLVYQHIFKSFLSITQVGMGFDAISTYKKETLIGIWECAGYLFLLLIPIIALVFFSIYEKSKCKETKYYSLSFKTAIIAVLIAVVFHCLGLLCLSNEGQYSPYEVYHDTFVLSKSQEYFGCLNSTRLEIRNISFGLGTGSIVEETIEQEIEDKPEFEYNSLDIDFNALVSDDDRISALNKYFASKQATKKNEYTGMFKDYNVITVVCESFSPYLIDAQRTPTLYKMANEGFVFNNYYGTISDNTSNSEYVLLNSLLPDTSLLGKGWDNFYEYNSCTASKNNYMPHTLNNVFKSQGLKSLGFHYYYGTYYGRKDTHPNFGMDFYYMTHGLKKSPDWPTSDLEMMQQSVPYYLQKNENGTIDRFCTYYLTFSGHMQYNFSTNNVANKNKAISDDLPYSEAVRAYVSCNQELEYAMEYLIDQLEEAGVMDNTLIVLLPDHYPYTLGLDKLSSLAETDLLKTSFDKEFNKFKGCLLMWSASMEEPIIVDDMMCELDVLPTMLNLLGMEFDSRLLMGTDIFSDSEHIAILGDRSFITDKLYFDSSTGDVTLKDGENLDEEYIDRINNIVKNRFTVSTEILYTDYYRYIYGAN